MQCYFFCMRYSYSFRCESHDKYSIQLCLVLYLLLDSHLKLIYFISTGSSALSNTHTRTHTDAHAHTQSYILDRYWSTSLPVTTRVDKDLTIKIADFGLTKDIYCTEYYRMGRDTKIPIKWMPPESIYDQYFDQKSDVVCLNFNRVCITIPINTIINSKE